MDHEDIGDPTTVRGSDILNHSLHADHEYRVKRYDFKRPDKFSKEQLRTVMMLHETVSRLFSTVLGNIGGMPAEISCASVDQLTYEEFIRACPPIGVYIPTRMPPLKGAILIQIDGSLAEFLVRCACGSVDTLSRKLETPTRALTEIETIVLQDTVERLLPSMNEAWQILLPLSAAIGAIDIEPQYVQIVPPSEMIILVSLKAEINDSEAYINLAIPYLTIEPIIGKLSAQYWYSSIRRGPTPAVMDRVADLPTEIELYSDADPVSLSDLPGVAAGGLLRLPSLSDGFELVRSGGVPVAEVDFVAESLAGNERLDLAVRSFKSGPVSRRLVGQIEGAPSLAGQVSISIDSLGQQIRDVRRAVEEIREDRETLLASMTDGADSSVDQDREQELDRRHHRDIAVAMAHEDPATIGFVLAALTAETAAAVLSDLDSSIQPAVVAAIARLGDADRQLHRRVLSFIGRRVQTSRESSTGGGPDVVAEILNNTPRSLEQHVMDEYQRRDPELFEEIARRMFIYEDMILLDPKAIVRVAALVEPEELALSLKGIPQEVRTHILDSLDEEMRESVQRNYDSMGPVRRRDAEAAQRDIIEELRVLEQKGEIKIVRFDEDEVIE